MADPTRQAVDTIELQAVTAILESHKVVDAAAEEFGTVAVSSVGNPASPSHPPCKGQRRRHSQLAGQLTRYRRHCFHQGAA